MSPRVGLNVPEGSVGSVVVSVGATVGSVGDSEGVPVTGVVGETRVVPVGIAVSLEGKADPVDAGVALPDGSPAATGRILLSSIDNNTEIHTTL